MHLFIYLILFSFSAYASEDSIDLRAKMTEVKHQGKRGTCSVFAATALMEFLIREDIGIEMDLSEANAFYAARKYTLTTPSLRGYLQRDALAGALAVEGYMYESMLEEEWPYQQYNWLQLKDPRCNLNSPHNECFVGERPEGARNLGYRISPVYIDRKEMGEFLLREKKPIVFNIKWIYAAVDKQTGVFRMPIGEEEKHYGGHVILLVGYDRIFKTFIFRNSWGQNWGDGGYGTIPEEYLINYCEACNGENEDFATNSFNYKVIRGVSGNLIK